VLPKIAALIAYKHVVDSNAGQALASGQIGEHASARGVNQEVGPWAANTTTQHLSTILSHAAAGRIS
jgi:hypothetical protein